MEGVVGLSWGFGLPLHDVIRGSVVDYMHCICEGVVDQLIALSGSIRTIPRNASIWV